MNPWLNAVTQVSLPPPAPYVGRPNWREKKETKPIGRTKGAVERYIEALGKRKQSTAAQIAEDLDVSVVTVRKFMRTNAVILHVTTMTTSKAADGKHRYIWKLK